MIEQTALAIVFGWALFATWRWDVERDKRRDLHTDMSQLLHDEQITKADLRRSKDHDELQRWFDD